MTITHSIQRRVNIFATILAVLLVLALSSGFIFDHSSAVGLIGGSLLILWAVGRADERLTERRAIVRGMLTSCTAVLLLLSLGACGRAVPTQPEKIDKTVHCDTLPIGTGESPRPTTCH